MIKTILLPVLVGSFALCASASEVSSAAGRMEASSQDFNACTIGSTSVHREAEGSRYFWAFPDNATELATEVEYVADGRYLDVRASERPEDGLLRLLSPRDSLSSPVISAYTEVAGAYSGFYCQFKTKFPFFDAGTRPEVDGRDRLVLWACGNKLYATAGRYVGGLHTVESCDYVLPFTVSDPTAWYTVTLRVIPDIQVGAHALAFQIWINGDPATVGNDGSVTDGSFSLSAFTAEARVLMAQKRLFPALTLPGVNESVALGGAAFTGDGSVDDFVYSFNAPDDWAKPPRVFTLNWDAGVKTVSYTVGSGAPVTVPAAVISERNTVFEIPAVATDIKVAVTYDTNCSKGSWSASGACSYVESDTFRCDASVSAGFGMVRSARPEISIGGTDYASFADAKADAIKQNKPIALEADFNVADKSADAGRIYIEEGETVTIDLKGHVLGTTSGEFPTIINRGTLTIIDTVGGGRVKPYCDYFGNGDVFSRTVINNFATKGKGGQAQRPTLVIKGGIFDGIIYNAGEQTSLNPLTALEGELKIERNGSTDEPKFISKGGDEFEFSDKLADAKLYYDYAEPYWHPGISDAFIWCGKGSDDKWSTPANWRCKAVPGADDLAIFPASGTNVWVADMGKGVAVKNILLTGDVFLLGSNDFTAVTWKEPVTGRISGDAIMAWSGKLPPDLSSLLDETWAGTVAVAGVGNASPKRLIDMASWGTEYSTVRFSGVRGYYDKSTNLSVPWSLELVNGVNGYAWKNDAGFTGGVIEFPSLVGYGTFISPKNTIANRQVIIFRDVENYKGLLDVQGKRVVLGPGEAATLEAGSITWSDKVKVTAGVAHQCVVAAFGGTMSVNGTYDAVLANYSGSTVGDSAEVVTLLPGDFTAELCVDDPVGVVKIARWSENAVIVNGRRVVKTALGAVNSKIALSAPVSSLSLSRVPFASYYTPSVVTNGGMVTMKFALNELAVPVLGGTGEESAKVTFADGMVSIVVSNAIDGLWYGLEYKASFGDEWPSEPYVWTIVGPQGGNQVELNAPAEGATGFYRVVVSDVDPTEGGVE